MTERDQLLGLRARHVAEIAIIDEQLAAPTEVHTIDFAHEREELLRRRAQIIQRRDYRRAQHEEARQAEIRRCGYTNPVFIERHLANVFGPGARLRAKQDEQDERELDYYDRALARLRNVG